MQGRVIDGRYRVERLLGSGGMGAVYAAEQLQLARAVALKVLRPGVVDEAFRSRFRAEAMATSRLNHPNIVTVHDFGIDVSEPLPLPYLVLERLEGRTLRERLSQHGPLAIAAGVAVLRGIAQALDAAHSAGIVHRDLKPENIFLVTRSDDANAVKVLDFGIAKIFDTAGAHTVTATGVVVGTPGYVAPERMQSGTDDARSDFYALGVIAWEIFTGRPPLDAPTPMALSLKHMVEDIPRLDAGHVVPAAVADLVASLLMKDPERRPRDARTLLTTLRTLTAQTLDASAPAASTAPPTSTPPLPALAAPPTVPTPSAPGSVSKPRRTTAGVVGALVGVVALAALAGVAFQQRRSAREIGADAHAAGNYGAARDAWRAACEDDRDGAACGLLGDLAFASLAVGIDSFGALALYQRGCEAGDTHSCVQRGRHREHGIGMAIDAGEALAAYERACDLGDVLGCFHFKVATTAGIGESRNELGTIDVTDAERAAAEHECWQVHNDSACFALSLVNVRLARVAHDDDAIGAIRRSWQHLCDVKSVQAACLWQKPSPAAQTLVVEGIAYAAGGAYPRAQHAAERALEVDPDNTDAHYNLAVAHVLQGNTEEAKRLLRRLHVLNPTLALGAATDPDFAALQRMGFFGNLQQ